MSGVVVANLRWDELPPTRTTVVSDYAARRVRHFLSYALYESRAGVLPPPIITTLLEVLGVGRIGNYCCTGWVAILLGV